MTPSSYVPQAYPAGGLQPWAGSPPAGSVPVPGTEQGPNNEVIYSGAAAVLGAIQAAQFENQQMIGEDGWSQANWLALAQRAIGLNQPVPPQPPLDLLFTVVWTIDPNGTYWIASLQNGLPAGSHAVLPAPPTAGTVAISGFMEQIENFFYFNLIAGLDGVEVNGPPVTLSAGQTFVTGYTLPSSINGIAITTLSATKRGGAFGSSYYRAPVPSVS